MTGNLSQELQRLDDFLLGDSVPEDAMLLSELDGFLAGLNVCPELVSPSEWLPVVWGDEDGPVFDDVDRAQDLSNLIMGRYDTIARQLDQGRYRPVYDFNIDGSALWETWMEGFATAVSLRPEAWLAWITEEDENEDLQQAWFIIERLVELAGVLGEVEPMEIDEELEAHAPDLIPEAVETLHRYRRGRTGHRGRSAKENLPKVGRNQPCPCGSGKKYKKCCGGN